MPSAAPGEKEARFEYSDHELERHTRELVAFAEDRRDASTDDKRLLPALRAALYLRMVLSCEHEAPPIGRVRDLGLLQPLTTLCKRLAKGPLSTSAAVSVAQRIKQRILHEGLWILTNIASGSSPDTKAAVDAGVLGLCSSVIKRCAAEVRAFRRALEKEKTSAGLALAEEFSIVLNEESKRKTRSKPVYLPCGPWEIDDDGYGGAPPEVWRALGLAAHHQGASSSASASTGAGSAAAVAEAPAVADMEVDVSMEDDDDTATPAPAPAPAASAPAASASASAASGATMEAVAAGVASLSVSSAPPLSDAALTLPPGIYFGRRDASGSSSLFAEYDGGEDGRICRCFLDGRLEGHMDGHSHDSHLEAMEAHYARLGPLTTLSIADQAVFCMGNIAGDSAGFRDACHVAGAAAAIGSLMTNYFDCLWEIHRRCRDAKEARILHPDGSFTLLSNLAWGVSNLARGKPRVNTTLLRPLYLPMATLLASRSAGTVLDATWFFVYSIEAECDAIGTGDYGDRGEGHCLDFLRRVIMTPVVPLPQTLCTGYLPSVFAKAHARVPPLAAALPPSLSSHEAALLPADAHSLALRARLAALAKALKERTKGDAEMPGYLSCIIMEGKGPGYHELLAGAAGGPGRMGRGLGAPVAAALRAAAADDEDDDDDSEEEEAEEEEDGDDDAAFLASAAMLQPHAVIRALQGESLDTLGDRLEDLPGAGAGGAGAGGRYPPPSPNKFSDPAQAIVVLDANKDDKAAKDDIDISGSIVAVDGFPTVLDLFVTHISGVAESFRHRLHSPPSSSPSASAGAAEAVAEAEAEAEGEQPDGPFVPRRKGKDKEKPPAFALVDGEAREADEDEERESPFMAAQIMVRAVNTLTTSDHEGSRIFLKAGALDAVCKLSLSCGCDPKSRATSLGGETWWGVSNVIADSTTPTAWAFASPYFRRLLAVTLCPRIAAYLRTKKGSLVSQAWASELRPLKTLKELSFVLENALRWLDVGDAKTRADAELARAEAEAFRRGAERGGAKAKIVAAAAAGAGAAAPVSTMPQAPKELVSALLDDPFARERASLRPFLYTLAGLFRSEELVPGEEGERLLQSLAADVNARPWAYWILPYHSAPQAVVCSVDMPAAGGGKGKAAAAPSPVVIRTVPLASLTSARAFTGEDEVDAVEGEFGGPEAQAYVDVDAMWASVVVAADDLGLTAKAPGAEKKDKKEKGKGAAEDDPEPLRPLSCDGGDDIDVLCGAALPTSLTPLVGLAQLQQAKPPAGSGAVSGQFKGFIRLCDFSQLNPENPLKTFPASSKMTPLLPLIFATCEGILEGLRARAAIAGGASPDAARAFERMAAHASALLARKELIDTGRLGAVAVVTRGGRAAKSLGLHRWGGPKEDDADGGRNLLPLVDDEEEDEEEAEGEDEYDDEGEDGEDDDDDDE